MTHNANVEMQGKCRRLFFAKVDGPPIVDVDADGNHTDRSGTFQYRAGDVLNIASAGGAIETLTGDDLIIATYNDLTAPDRIGCIEMFYNPIPATKPKTINLEKVAALQAAVAAYKEDTAARLSGLGSEGAQSCEAMLLARDAAITFDVLQA